MANVDLKLFGKNNLKKGTSVASGVIEPAKLTKSNDGLAKDGELAIGDVVTLFSLPANCVITDAYIYVRVGDTGSSTATLKIDAGAVKTLINGQAVGSASNAPVGSLQAKAGTGTGVDVQATVGAAPIKGGVYEVVVEYVELGRTIGEYTK